MPDKTLTPLKIYTIDNDIISLINKTYSCVVEENPILADVWLSTPNVFSKSVDNVIDYVINDGKKVFYMSPLTHMVDSFTLLQYAETRITKISDIISIVPNHLFSLSDSFDTFKDKYKGSTFDLICSINNEEDVIDSDLIENLIAKYEHILATGISHNVWYNKEKKYFIRVTQPTSPAYTYVFGGNYLNEERVNTIATNTPISPEIHLFIRRILSDYIGFFTLKFYKNDNKYMIYQIDTKFNIQLLYEDIEKNDMVRTLLVSIGGLRYDE